MTDWNFVKTLRDDVHMLYQKFSKVYECFLNTDGSLYTDVHTGKYSLDTKEQQLILVPDDGWHDNTFGDQTYYYKYTVTNDYLTITTGLGTERYNRKT